LHHDGVPKGGVEGGIRKRQGIGIAGFKADIRYATLGSIGLCKGDL
jgi:hypothetical protein